LIKCRHSSRAPSVNETARAQNCAAGIHRLLFILPGWQAQGRHTSTRNAGEIVGF
jgi:hypothetical protein